MYSAIILSVNGVTSKLSNCSILFTVPCSVLRAAHTLNFVEHLIDPFWLPFSNMEVQEFGIIEFVKLFDSFI